MSNPLLKSKKEIYVPAEWSAHKCIWVGFPSHADLWLENLDGAQAEVAAMVKALSVGDQMNVIVANAEARAAAEILLAGTKNVTIFDADFGDIWIRDTGCIFTNDGQALRFKNNGWGGKYDLEHDDSIGDKIAEFAKTPVINFDFILEGGAVDQDGAGTLLTTRQCVLNENRNQNWDEQTATKELCNAFGASKVIWLNDGMLNDHTDGHVDNIARFIAPDTIICQRAADDNDPNKQVFEDIADILRASTNANGEPLNIVQIPSPGCMTNEDGDIIPASHMNFIIGNKVVVVPTYGTATANAAVEEIAKLFPHHKVVGLPSHHILSGGGSFHCLTQQQPLV